MHLFPALLLSHSHNFKCFSKVFSLMMSCVIFVLMMPHVLYSVTQNIWWEIRPLWKWLITRIASYFHRKSFRMSTIYTFLFSLGNFRKNQACLAQDTITLHNQATSWLPPSTPDSTLSPWITISPRFLLYFLSTSTTRKLGTKNENTPSSCLTELEWFSIQLKGMEILMVRSCVRNTQDFCKTFVKMALKKAANWAVKSPWRLAEMGEMEQGTVSLKMLLLCS